MQAYLDTSVLLRLLLGEARPYKKLDRYSDLYSSELIHIETMRTLDRLRLVEQWDEKLLVTRIKIFHEMMASLHLVHLHPLILKRAADPFVLPVKTLDALHIATALACEHEIKSPLLFLTHDIHQARVAMGSGLTVAEELLNPS